IERPGLTGKILSPKELAIRYSVFNELLLQGIVSSRLWGEVKGNRERRRAELEVKIPAPSTSSGRLCRCKRRSDKDGASQVNLQWKGWATRQVGRAGAIAI